MGHSMKKKKLSRESRRKLLDILASKHSHSELGDWAKCESCQARFLKYKQAKVHLTEQERKELENETIDRAIEIFARQYVEKVKQGLLKANPLKDQTL